MTYAKATVLVVEDEPLLRMGIVDHLEDEGFSVIEAGDAEKAIDLLAGNSEIQIVFTDVNMPGPTDGLMLASLITDGWPQVKVFVTSGHRHIHAEELPAGATFVPKPYNPHRLSDSFRRHVAG